MLSYLYSLEYEDEDETTMKDLRIPEVEHVHVNESGVSSRVPSSPIFSEDAMDSKDASTSESQKRIHHRMLNNIAVYAIADKYDIPPLKEMARAKFQTIISTIRPYQEFPTVVKAAFDSTPQSDQGLRSIVTKFCALHVGELLQLQGPGASEMRDIGQLGWGILSLVKNNSDLERELQSEIDAANEVDRRKMEEEACGLIQERDSWKNQYEASIRQRDSILDAAGCVKTCRHCGATGAMLVEQGQSMALNAFLRCAKCRTKHSLDYKVVSEGILFGSML